MLNKILLLICLFSIYRLVGYGQEKCTQEESYQAADLNKSASIFKGKTFQCPQNFGSLQFYKFADFSNASFDTSAYFASAIFEQPLLFTGSTIGSWANFDAVHFKSWCEFDSVVFNKNSSDYASSFIAATFDDSAFFYKAKFRFVYFDSARFKSYTNFSMAYSDSMRFVNAEFDSGANFNSMTVSKWGNFDSVHFKSWCDFSYADFQTTKMSSPVSPLAAGFSYNQFDDSAFFERVKFHFGNFHSSNFKHYASFFQSQFDSAGFVNTTFDGGLAFDSVKVTGWINFDSVHFKSWCDFSNTVFGTSAKYLSVAFLKAKFDSTAWFINTQFTDSTQFFRDTIQHVLYFDSARFRNKVYFNYLSFGKNGGLSFFKTILPDTLDFSYNVDIPTEINFSEANFSDSTHYNYKTQQYRKHEINLYRSDISKIKIDYLHFHLYFDPHDSISDDEKESVYEALLKNFSDRGQKESYKLLDIDYNDWQAGHHVFTWISGWWWSYGYEKWRILIWTIVILLLFSLFNVFIYDNLYATYAIQQLDKSAYTFSKNPVLTALEKYWLSIMYTGFIFFKLSIDFDKIQVKNWGILLLIFFEYAVGLLCTGYLLNWVLSK